MSGYRTRRYGVFGCYKCRSLGIADLSCKTHTCKSCGKTLQIRKVNVMYSSDKLKDAAWFLRQKKAMGKPFGFVVNLIEKGR